MKKIFYVFVLLTTHFNIAYSQDVQKFVLKGNAKAIIDNDTIPAYDLLLSINNTGLVSNTKKNGNFKFNTLQKGNYHLRSANTNFDTLINLNGNKNIQLFIRLDCENSKQQAINDIKNNSAKLLLIGGIAPVIYSTDKNFKDKYSISYFDYGCLPPDYNCIISY
ncbi:MAG: hypothetical protein EOO47_14555, partial [Flavobacterium sp.]